MAVEPVETTSGSVTGRCGLWNQLKHLSSQVENTMDVLSTHEEMLGCCFRYVTTAGWLHKYTPRRTRLSKKQCAVEAERFKVLVVFALASWVQMTERWHNMPHAPDRHLNMVCNMPPLELRSLGKLV